MLDIKTINKDGFDGGKAMKKLLSAVLALAMCLTPISVFADTVTTPASAV